MHLHIFTVHNNKRQHRIKIDFCSNKYLLSVQSQELQADIVQQNSQQIEDSRPLTEHQDSMVLSLLFIVNECCYGKCKVYELINSCKTSRLFENNKK
jgi:hypothetical protein